MSRGIKPDIGHLVRARAGSVLDIDLAKLRPTAIVVAKRGIAVQIALPFGKQVWVRRDLLEVISEGR
jgi:hypothetical protein